MRTLHLLVCFLLACCVYAAAREDSRKQKDASEKHQEPDESGGPTSHEKFSVPTTSRTPVVVPVREEKGGSKMDKLNSFVKNSVDHTKHVKGQEVEEKTAPPTDGAPVPSDGETLNAEELRKVLNDLEYETSVRTQRDEEGQGEQEGGDVPAEEEVVKEAPSFEKLPDQKVQKYTDILDPPDIYEAAGIDRNLVEKVTLVNQESDTTHIRRHLRVKYRQVPDSAKYKLEIWIQSYPLLGGAWTTHLQTRKFLSEVTIGGAEIGTLQQDEVQESSISEPNMDGFGDGEEEGELEVEEEDLTPEQLEAKELYNNGLQLLSAGSFSASKRAYQFLSGAAVLNHTKSRELVAFSLFFGDHLPQNFTKSMEMFQQLAEEGNPRGQLGLGIMYASGDHVNSSQAKALVFITFAALGGDELAQMILGYRHLSGIGVQTSCETALIYYGKAAKKVADRVSLSGGPVVQRIRLYDEVESTASSSSNVLDDDLIQYYQFLADKGDTSAQLGLGQLYYQGGRGVVVDYDLALHYFTQASELGSANADGFLGRMYAEGVGNLKQDYQMAYEYFLKAADQGNPVGQSGLGMLYLKGHAVSKDIVKALHYFQKSADQNWVDGQLQLGLMYFKGEGVRKDHKSALKYFNLASQNGNVLAYYNLAQMHASGLGVMRACHTAVELFKNVAERGPWSKMLVEGFDFHTRGYVDVAMLKYLIAAELGYEVAQSNVAFILDSGESEAYKNNDKYKRALLQWSRAAGQGSTVARIKLGDYHYYGLGTDVDYELAIQHYRVAGEQQNNAQAMYNLAYMHEVGLGLKQDLHLAKRFYDMAADTSKDAHIPVSLALIRLNFISSFDSLTNSSELWQIISNFHPQLYLGPSWDMYMITILGMLFGLIVMIRTQLVHPA